MLDFKLIRLGFPKRFLQVSFDIKKIPAIKTFLSMEQIRLETGFYFYGNFDAGKTTIACLLVKKLCELGLVYTARFLNFSDLLSNIYNDDLFYKLYNSQVLVVDDFGCKVCSEKETDAIYRFINHRYSNNMFTIFTSNYSIVDLSNNFVPEDSSVRILSRIAKMAAEVRIQISEKDWVW